MEEAMEEVVPNRELSQGMCYFLRHGGSKEGLSVYRGGFVEIEELAQKLRTTKEAIIREVSVSISHNGTKRFQIEPIGDLAFVQATYGHSFAIDNLTPLPTLLPRVPKLFSLCVSCISKNLDKHQFEYCMDTLVLEAILNELRQKEKLTVASLKRLFVPGLENLRLDDVYISESTLKLLANNCPNLRSLNMRALSYVLTDSLLLVLAKRLKSLHKLIISENSMITDNSLTAIGKNLKELRFLDLRRVSNITSGGVEKLLSCLPNLEEINIKGCPQLIESGFINRIKENFPKIKVLSDFGQNQVRFQYHEDGIWGALSNNYPSPFRLKGMIWQTVTHYYQAQKFSGTNHELTIQEAKTYSQAFRLGRTESVPIRTDWEQVKNQVMFDGIYAKMIQNEKIASLLLLTNDMEIVFGNWKDEYWGCGKNNTGQNHLGQTLSQVREVLKKDLKK